LIGTAESLDLFALGHKIHLARCQILAEAFLASPQVGDFCAEPGSIAAQILELLEEAYAFGVEAGVRLPKPVKLALEVALLARESVALRNDFVVACSRDATRGTQEEQDANDAEPASAPLLSPLRSALSSALSSY